MLQKDINKYLVENYKPSFFTKYGPYYLIQHYAHSEGNQIIIARTSNQALNLLDKIENDKNRYKVESIKFAEHINVVPYPKIVFLSWAQKRHKELVEIWSRNLCLDALEIYEKESKIVGPFIPCIEYKCKHGFSPDDDMLDYYKERHIDCVNCDSVKMKFKSDVDVDALYIKNKPSIKMQSEFCRGLPSHYVGHGHGTEVYAYEKNDLKYQAPYITFNIIPSEFSKLAFGRVEDYKRLDEEKVARSLFMGKQRKLKEEDKRLELAKKSLASIFGET